MWTLVYDLQKAINGKSSYFLATTVQQGAISLVTWSNAKAI